MAQETPIMPEEITESPADETQNTPDVEMPEVDGPVPDNVVHIYNEALEQVAQEEQSQEVEQSEPTEPEKEQEAPAAEEQAKPAKRKRGSKATKADKADEPEQKTDDEKISDAEKEADTADKEEPPEVEKEPEATESPRPEEQEQVKYLKLSELFPFKDHPFSVRSDEEMAAMVASVKDKGVTTPAVVRPREDGGYELVSGHRRQKASELAGYLDIPLLSGLF